MQDAWSVRLEWGVVGAPVVAHGCDAVIVVDVLSFTTTLGVAADRGVTVMPCPWRDARAEELAHRYDATLAVRRSEAGPGDVSLSPATVRAAEHLERLVLPSPNGSTICAELADLGVPVVGASLRNRRAVARWLDDRIGDARSVAVVAAGERWSDTSLRPAVEDLWGAGAVVRALVEAGATSVSPEARAASAAFDAVVDDLPDALRDCASGQELIGLGYGVDVDVAAELDASGGVPVLVDGVFADGVVTGGVSDGTASLG